MFGESLKSKVLTNQKSEIVPMHKFLVLTAPNLVLFLRGGKLFPIYNVQSGKRNLWFVQQVNNQCQWFTMVLNQMDGGLKDFLKSI